MIIDVHTHPPADRAKWPEFLDCLRFHGIDHAVTSFLHSRWPQFPTPEELREANAHARDFAASAEGCVLWLAYVNPHNANWREELDACLAEGARGVKLWVSVKDAEGKNVGRSVEVLHAAGEKGLPVLVHSCNRTEPEFPGEADTADVAFLAREAPQTIVIEGHAGGNWRKGLGLREGIANLYIDISAYYPERGELARLLRDTDVDRVMFGSDFGLRDLSSQLAKVYFAGLEPEAMEKILWRNAARTFGFPALDSMKPAAVPPLAPEASPDLPDPATEHFSFCGRWPFDVEPCAPATLHRDLRKCRVDLCYTADADSIFCDDLIRANARFLLSVRGLRRIAPLATLDPDMPGWPAQARQAREEFRGGFLSPYLHAYRLDDERHREFHKSCADMQIPLWINCAAGDHRWRHRAVRPRPVAPHELLAFLESAPPNGYVFQGLGKDAMEAALEKFPGREDVRFELSRLTDFPGHLVELLQRFGPDRLAFGSEYPLRDLGETRWAASQALRFARRTKRS